jgi:hypothetical protein
MKDRFALSGGMINLQAAHVIGIFQPQNSAPLAHEAAKLRLELSRQRAGPKFENCDAIAISQEDAQEVISGLMAIRQ